MSGENVDNKEIPWWKLHEIGDQLNGKLNHITCVDHTGKTCKRIVIEYTEDTKVMEAVIYSNGNQECERVSSVRKTQLQIQVYKLNQLL